jgi:hypothetical protein
VKARTQRAVHGPSQLCYICIYIFALCIWQLRITRINQDKRRESEHWGGGASSLGGCWASIQPRARTSSNAVLELSESKKGVAIIRHFIVFQYNSLLYFLLVGFYLCFTLLASCTMVTLGHLLVHITLFVLLYAHIRNPPSVSTPFSTAIKKLQTAKAPRPRAACSKPC